MSGRGDVHLASALTTRFASISATKASAGLRLALIAAEEGAAVMMSAGRALDGIVPASLFARFEIAVALIFCSGGTWPEAVACLLRHSVSGAMAGYSTHAGQLTSRWTSDRDALAIQFVSGARGAAFVSHAGDCPTGSRIVPMTGTPFDRAYRFASSGINPPSVRADGLAARRDGSGASAPAWLQVPLAISRRRLAGSRGPLESPEDRRLARAASTLGRDIARAVRRARQCSQAMH